MSVKTIIAFCALLSLVGSAPAADHFDTLEAKGRTYRDAYVLSASDAAIVIKHSGGIGQIPLQDLEPEMQARYGYDPARSAAELRKREQERRAQADASRQRLESLAAASAAAKASPNADLVAAAHRFGQAPELKDEIDLRSRYSSYGLTVRNQWQQPSCSIFAIVGAVEYQFARYKLGAFNFSEGYLYDATLKSLGLEDARGRSVSTEDESDDESGPPSDAGFALPEVLQAIRAYGLALEGETLDQVDETSALARARFGWRVVPGRDVDSKITNMIHVLNTETPLVLSLAWPVNKSLARTSVLSEQTPREGAGHAVTVVGYRCRTGRLEDVTLIFRNSWGPYWGAGGYGFIRYKYLVKNMHQAYVVDPM